MDMLEPLLRLPEVVQRHLDVARHLALLTRNARVRPLCHVCADSGPNKLRGDQPTRGPDARVGEVVEGVENLTPEWARHQWPDHACGRVAEERLLTDRYPLEL